MKIFDYWKNEDLKNYGRVIFLEDSDLNSSDKNGRVFGIFCISDFKVIENAYYVFYLKNNLVQPLKAYNGFITSQRTQYLSLENVLDILKEKIDFTEWLEMMWDLYDIKEEINN
jgi:hypothetical protein